MRRRSNCFCSYSEDGGSDAHAGRTFFDGDFELMGHAHRKRVEVDGRNIAGGELVAQFAKLAEIWSATFGIFSVRRHGHQATNAKVRPRWRLAEDGFDL